MWQVMVSQDDVLGHRRDVLAAVPALLSPNTVLRLLKIQASARLFGSVLQQIC